MSSNLTSIDVFFSVFLFGRIALGHCVFLAFFVSDRDCAISVVGLINQMIIPATVGEVDSLNGSVAVVLDIEGVVGTIASKLRCRGPESGKILEIFRHNNPHGFEQFEQAEAKRRGGSQAPKRQLLASREAESTSRARNSGVHSTGGIAPWSRVP